MELQGYTLLVASGAPVSTPLLKTLAQNSQQIIAVDGGYRYCCKAGIQPQELLGDMDSIKQVPKNEENLRIIKLPCEKDDTDTLFAVRSLLKKGIKNIVITCALGERLDHTIANLQTLLFAARHGVQAVLLDDTCCVRVLLPGSYVIEQQAYDTFSLFSMGDLCKNVCIKNARYPLEKYDMGNDFPLGVSNEFLEGQSAKISFESGALLFICSKNMGKMNNEEY